MNNSTIKFDHVPNKAIPFNNGKTSFSDLFTIGAMTLASEMVFTRVDRKQEARRHYPTDLAGLESVSSKSEELLATLHNAISAISVLLVYVDKDEIESELDSIAWLLAGLGELSEQVAYSNNNMKYELIAQAKKGEL